MFYIIEFRIAINEIRKCVFESTDCFNDNPLVFNEGQKVYNYSYMYTVFQLDNYTMRIRHPEVTL